MRTLTMAALSLTVAAFAVSANAAPKYMSWEGTWHLDNKATIYPSYVHVTDNDLVVTKDDGDKLVYTETVVSDGKTDVQKYDGAYDGKYYDMGQGESMAFTHIGVDKARAVRHDGNGFVRENSVFELTNHGKTLVCHAWAQHAPGGKEVAFDEIFNKAP